MKKMIILTVTCLFLLGKPTIKAQNYHGTASAGTKVWLDLNENGIAEPTELGFSGITLILRDTNEELIGFRTSDIRGFYSFENFIEGDYTIEVDEESIPNGFTLSTPEKRNVTFKANDYQYDINFGIVPIVGSTITERCTEEFTSVELTPSLEEGEVIIIEHTYSLFDCNITSEDDYSVTYTPFPGLTGTDVIALEICKAGNTPACRYEIYLITAGCNVPTALNDFVTLDNQEVILNGESTLTTNAYEGIAIDVLANDVDKCHNVNSLSILESTNEAALSIVDANTIFYQPTPDFVGKDTILYQVCNDCGSCNSAMVVVDVLETACESFTKYICTEPITPVIITPTFCLRGDYEIVEVCGIFDCSMSFIEDYVQYIALPGFYGNDIIEIVACTTSGVCDTATITIKVGDCRIGENIEKGELSLNNVSYVPAIKEVNISFKTGQAENASLEIFDLRGQLVLKKEVQAEEGDNYYRLPLENYPRGMYVVVVKNQANTITGKFVK